MERVASGAGEDAGAAADATGEFAWAATAGVFFLRCFFPAAGAARNSTKTGFGVNLGEFPSWRTEMVCG